MISRRRILLAALAAAPWLARAQSALPVIAMLNTDASDEFGRARVETFREGLKSSGVIVGRDAELVTMWADGRYARLPALAESLVRRKVAVIYAAGLPAALAAKSASAEIPIVFVMGADPVKLGVVASLQRPGGNLTGVCQLYGELGAKRVEILRELMPSLKEVAVLSNPENANAKLHASNVEEAANHFGIRCTVFNASTEKEIAAAFAEMARKGLRAMLVADDPFYNVQRRQIVELAAKYALPVVHYASHFTSLGGLVSYGSDGRENTRIAAAYVAQVLKGAKPADLPVVQSAKFELVINMKTAKTLGIRVPQVLRIRANEVIE